MAGDYTHLETLSVTELVTLVRQLLRRVDAHNALLKADNATLRTEITALKADNAALKGKRHAKLLITHIFREENMAIFRKNWLCNVKPIY